MRHKSSLVCMVGVTCVYFDIIVLWVRFKTHLYCLVGCLSLIVWTHAVLGDLHAYGCIFVFALVQRS